MLSVAGREVNGSRVAVIGGSIAGCSAAIALRRLGCEVTVFERSQGQLQDRGSGIAIPIPLRDELIEHDYLPADYAHCTMAGRRWVADDGSPAGRSIWRLDGPMITNNWGVLWQNLRSRVPDSAYRDGADVIDVRQRSEGVGVTLADGTQSVYDVAIAADGYRSSLRAQLEQAVPEFAGYVLWRCNFAEDELTERAEWELIEDEGYWVSVGFDGGHGVIYPIPDFEGDGAPGARRVNWAIYGPAPIGLDVNEATSIPPGSVPASAYEQLEHLIELAFPETLRPLFASTPESVSIQPIYDTTVQTYVHDRIVLIGDAGTVARPHTATGATKAMQDARQLETLGAEHRTWGPLLAAYSQDRTKTGNELVELGRRIGQAQVVETPPWLSMTEADFQEWTTNTLSGSSNYLYGTQQATAARIGDS